MSKNTLIVKKRRLVGIAYLNSPNPQKLNILTQSQFLRNEFFKLIPINHHGTLHLLSGSAFRFVQTKLLYTKDDVLPDELPPNPEYRKLLLKLLQKLRKKQCLYLWKKVNVYKKESQKLVKHIVQKLFSLLFNIVSDKEKRFTEIEQLLKSQKMLFFKFFKTRSNKPTIVIPEDILSQILAYLPKNLKYLNSIGLVNDKFYLRALKSWRGLKISNNNLYKIPILVLRNVVFINFIITKEVYVQDLVYFKQNIFRLEKLIIGGEIIKFFKCIEKNIPKVVLNNVKTLIIDYKTTSKPFWNGKGKKGALSFPSLYFLPRLENLIIPSFNTNFNSKVKKMFKKLKNFRITPQSNEKGNQFNLKSAVIPEFMSEMESLEGLLIDSKLNEDGFKILLKNKNLLRLKLSVTDQKDITNIKKYVYTQEMNHLVELKLDFKTFVNGVQYKMSGNYLENIANLNCLKLLILEFHLKTLPYLQNVNLDCLRHLNDLSKIEKIVLEFKVYSPIKKEKEEEEEEKKLGKYFQSLLHKIKFSKIDKIKVKYRNRVINFRKKTVKK